MCFWLLNAIQGKGGRKITIDNRILFHLSWPICCWWLIWPIQNDAKKQLKNNRNPGTRVLIWEYTARAFQSMPTWQGLDGFQKSLHPCVLDVSSLSIGRVTSSLRHAEVSMFGRAWCGDLWKWQKILISWWFSFCYINGLWELWYV